MTCKNTLPAFILSCLYLHAYAQDSIVSKQGNDNNPGTEEKQVTTIRTSTTSLNWAKERSKY